MISKNGSTINKAMHLSFIENSIMLLLFSLALLFLVPCSVFIFAYWSEVPLFLKITWPAMMAVILAWFAFIPLNGMLITRGGRILFVPDFRFKAVKLKDVKRIAINFNEWDNDKYSATVKFVYSDGRIFVKDYSKSFVMTMNKYKI